MLFRRIENRIRMMHGRSEHTLPEDKSLQQELARRLGLEPNLDALTRSHKQAVHTLYTAILAD
jgi:glutamine synthetase adenylyltransferase